MKPLPFGSPLEAYERQADELLDRCRRGDAETLDLFRRKHPRFLSDEVPWLRKAASLEDVRRTSIVPHR